MKNNSFDVPAQTLEAPVTETQAKAVEIIIEEPVVLTEDITELKRQITSSKDGMVGLINSELLNRIKSDPAAMEQFAGAVGDALKESGNAMLRLNQFTKDIPEALPALKKVSERAVFSSLNEHSKLPDGNRYQALSTLLDQAKTLGVDSKTLSLIFDKLAGTAEVIKLKGKNGIVDERDNERIDADVARQKP